MRRRDMMQQAVQTLTVTTTGETGGYALRDMALALTGGSNVYMTLVSTPPSEGTVIFTLVYSVTTYGEESGTISQMFRRPSGTAGIGAITNNIKTPAGMTYRVFPLDVE